MAWAYPSWSVRRAMFVLLLFVLLAMAYVSQNDESGRLLAVLLKVFFRTDKKTKKHSNY